LTSKSDDIRLRQAERARMLCCKGLDGYTTVLKAGRGFAPRPQARGEARVLRRVGRRRKRLPPSLKAPATPPPPPLPLAATRPPTCQLASRPGDAAALRRWQPHARLGEPPGQCRTINTTRNARQDHKARHARTAPPIG
jgi:hypothetical protein